MHIEILIIIAALVVVTTVFTTAKDLKRFKYKETTKRSKHVSN